MSQRNAGEIGPPVGAATSARTTRGFGGSVEDAASTPSSLGYLNKPAFR